MLAVNAFHLPERAIDLAVGCHLLRQDQISTCAFCVRCMSAQPQHIVFPLYFLFATRIRTRDDSLHAILRQMSLKIASGHGFPAFVRRAADFHVIAHVDNDARSRCSVCDCGSTCGTWQPISWPLSRCPVFDKAFCTEVMPALYRYRVNKRDVADGAG